MVINSNYLKNSQLSEVYLEKLIDIYREKPQTSNNFQLYNQYNNLILHCFNSNIDKVFHNKILV